MFNEEYYHKLNKLAVAVGLASAFLSSKDEVPQALRENAKEKLNTAFDSLLNHTTVKCFPHHYNEIDFIPYHKNI